MKLQLWYKIKEALISVLPVSLIVIILNLTPLIDLSIREITIFIFSAIFLILGIGLFNLGADLAMQPMGEQIGSSLMKTKKIKIIILVCFIMGVLITIAEPDLSVLASQVQAVISSEVLMISIGCGVGIFLVLAALKIMFKKDLSMMLIFFYMVIFALVAMIILNNNESFLALSFDSGGVTTGPITVPFIMALGVGIAQTIGGREKKENSFGLIALCSIGPVIGILILGLTFSGEIPYSVGDYGISQSLFTDITSEILSVSLEVLLALGLIVLFFLIIQFIYIKLPKIRLIQIGIGILYTFVGLVIFLTAVNIGFMPIGFKMGTELANNSKIVICILCFILGMVTVLAEPAVHVLTKQVEEISTGSISKKSLLIALSMGVGISIFLSMIRIIFDFSILYYIIPGYILSLGLAFFVPKIYTAIAFDSGGVASGPLTSSFILPFAIGACLVLQGEQKIMQDAFGIVAMVAMTPLITIQILGFRSVLSKHVKERSRMRKIIDADDEQIISFME